MLKKVLVLMVLVTIVVAQEVSEEIIEKSETGLIEGRRRRKHRFGHHFFPLLGLGGLHALAAFVTIKLKIIIGFAILAATIFFGVKYLGGHGASCVEPSIIHEGPISPAIFPYDHYSGHSGHSGPSYYSGADPYSAYHSDSPSSSHSGSDISSSGPYRRIAKQRGLDDSLDWSEMTFTVLGLNSPACRKRFMCDVDVKASQNPLIGMAYNYISRSFFPQYRNFADPPKSLAECAKLYPECDEEKDQDEISESELNSIPDDEENENIISSDEERNDETTINSSDQTHENATNQPVGRLILRRSKLTSKRTENI